MWACEERKGPVQCLNHWMKEAYFEISDHPGRMNCNIMNIVSCIQLKCFLIILDYCAQKFDFSLLPSV